MTVNNDFLPLANGGGANVISQSDYAALTTLLANGFSAGIAQSNQVNKVLRQVTAIASMLGSFMQEQGQNANDDGNLATLLANFELALKSLVGSPNVFTGGTTTGSANAQVLATVNPSSGFSLTNGFTVIGTAGYTNSGNTTLNVHSSGVVQVQKLSGGSLVNLAAGDLTAGNLFTVNYNSTAGVWVLQSSGVTLGSAAFQNIAYFLQTSLNLSDVPNKAVALANLGGIDASSVPANYGANVQTYDVGSPFYVWNSSASPGADYSGGSIGVGAGTWHCMASVNIGGWGGGYQLAIFTRRV